MTFSSHLTIGRPTDEKEALAYADVLVQSLMLPSVEEFNWLERFGLDNIRIARSGGRVAGGLGLIPMGQWFGGRSVSMTGVSVVGVAPDHRSAGVGTALMRNALVEMRECGVALSALYPATQPVYRRAGYEQAGVRLRYKLPVRMIDTRDRSLELRPIAESDRDTLKRLYTQRARRTSGNLDRVEWNWLRVWKPRQSTLYGYVVLNAGAVEGYVLFTQETGASGRYDLHVLDLVALTAAAQRRLLTLFADHRSACDDVLWFGPPADPMLYILAEQEFGVDSRMDWMLRIVDVGAALEQRGYSSSVLAEVHLDVGDDILPENNRRFTLQVADGVGKVCDGGRGEVKIDVRGLATLYTGHLCPREMLTGSYIEGPAEALAAAAIFAGPAPWMPDSF